MVKPPAKKVAPKKVAPKKVAPKKVAPKKVAPKKLPAKKAAPKKVTPEKVEAASAELAAAVPLDWDEKISWRHWFPEPATLTELHARTKATVKIKAPAQAKKAWAQVAALFPPELAARIGKTPWRWSTIPSAQVAEVAMRRIADATRATTVAEVEQIEADLERILPELPALCLPEVVGEQVYSRAWESLEAAMNAHMKKAANDPVGWALHSLRGYLSTT